MTNEADLVATETLLIVDDEEMLVELLRRMMARQGYKVIIAKSGEEALRIYSERSNDINLVVTDLVMPGMDGKALAMELLKLNPNVRILVSTGYSAQSDISELLKKGVRGIVMKPYQSEQLYTKIREALEQAV